MKTFLYTTLFIILNAFTGYSQIISINDEAFPESKQSLEQLVTDVLISSNCSTVDNFEPKVYGAADDFQTKSYGYFKRPVGSSFPFEEGVILTTGRAFPAGNTIIDKYEILDNYNGDPNIDDNDGDGDLDDALSISGTQDATYIKFNFTPQVETISFRFLMASEEYNGVDECFFADSFAFLLREVGTPIYTNLAVLPDGITPVSVTNINYSSLIPDDPTTPNDDFKCDSNIEFFHGYYVGHTNYGGRTVALTASSAVTPGATYEIKLVVADQGDSRFDSAIFLEGGSFNIGGDLGEDYKISTNNPGCSGASIELDTNLSVAGATFKWYKNGVEIEDETGSTLNITTDGTYSFEATLVSGCSSSDEIIIEFADGSEILVPIQNSSNPQTIFARIEKKSNVDCYSTTSFKLIVNPLPEVEIEVTLTQCDDDTDGISKFNLTEANRLISTDFEDEEFTYYLDKGPSRRR